MPVSLVVAARVSTSSSQSSLSYPASPYRGLPRACSPVSTYSVGQSHPRSQTCIVSSTFLPPTPIAPLPRHERRSLSSYSVDPPSSPPDCRYPCDMYDKKVQLDFLHSLLAVSNNSNQRRISFHSDPSSLGSFFFLCGIDHVLIPGIS